MHDDTQESTPPFSIPSRSEAAKTLRATLEGLNTRDLILVANFLFFAWLELVPHARTSELRPILEHVDAALFARPDFDQWTIADECNPPGLFALVPSSQGHVQSVKSAGFDTRIAEDIDSDYIGPD